MYAIIVANTGCVYMYAPVTAAPSVLMPKILKRYAKNVPAITTSDKQTQAVPLKFAQGICVNSFSPNGNTIKKPMVKTQRITCTGL